MSFGFWSDEDRLFVPRLLGWSINFKFIAKRFGWIKPTSESSSPEDDPQIESAPANREERLRQAIEDSRYEDK